MKINADKILVIDVEATCWEGNPPPGMQNEIIEIGLCLLDVRTRRPEGKRSIMVRPQRSTVSPFCTQLTTITPEMAAKGVSFSEAIDILFDDYDAPNLPWASYGEYDKNQFRRQCASAGVDYPFSDTHINVKTSIAEARNWHKPVGMHSALAKLNLPLLGTHHRGHDDAWNIACILATMLD